MLKRLEYFYATFYKHPMVCTAFGAMIVVLIYTSEYGIASIFVIFLCIGIIFVRRKSRVTFFVASGILMFSLTALIYYRSYDASLLNSLEKTITVEGEIVFFPSRGINNQSVVVKPFKIYDQQQVQNQKLLLVKFDKYAQLEKGDKLIFSAQFLLTSEITNPGYQNYLVAQEIIAVADRAKIISLDKTKGMAQRFINDTRNNIEALVRKAFSEPQASLLLGMLMGSKEDFISYFDAALRKTGTTHVVAVSGYNVNLVTSSVLGLAGFLPRKLALYLALILIFVFISLVGFDNLPAIRAGIMGSTVIVSKILGKKSLIPSFLAIACIIMLIHNPYVYKSLSFQLSFSSTCGLILLADPLANLLQKTIPDFLVPELATTLSATLMTLPITYINFAHVSFISPLVNLLIADLVPMITITGILYIVFSKIVIIGFLLMSVLNVLLALFIKIIMLFAELSYASGKVPLLTNFGIILLAVCLGLMILEFYYRQSSKYE